MAAEVDHLTKNEGYIKKALSLKEEGNALYKAKDYNKAVSKYHRALMQLKAVGLVAGAEMVLQSSSLKLPQSMIDEKDQLMSECYNNLAACLLTREAPDYQRVVGHCEKVLEHNNSNVKAAFRMAKALHHLGQLDRAHDIINSQPQFLRDKSMQALLKLIQEKQKRQDEKLKSTYQRMFQTDSQRKKEEEAKRRREVRDIEPILIKNSSVIGGARAVSGDCAGAGAGAEAGSKNGAVPSFNSSAAEPGTQQSQASGPKLIHVASAEKEAAC